MKRKIMTLTDEQAQAMSREYQALFEQALAQLTEHRMYIRMQLEAITPEQWRQLSDGVALTHYDELLMAEVEEIKLGSVRVEPALKEGNKPTVSVVYEFPSVLGSFLMRTDIPMALRRVLQGGIAIDELPAITKA